MNIVWFFMYVGEIGDVPSNKVDENVHSPFQGKVPQKVQKNRRSWSKVHAKLFQK